MKYHIGEKYTFPDGKVGIIEDARKDILGKEEYDVNVEGKTILVLEEPR